MRKWLRRLRGAAGMGLAWAIAGAGVGGLIELLANVLPGGFPMASAIDMWPQALGMVGFIGGAFFAIILGVAGARRRFDELSLPLFASWGAVAGLLLGGLGMVLGAPAVFIGVTTIGSSIAGAGSLALARMAEQRVRLDTGAEVPAVGRGGGEAETPLGDER